MDPLVDSKSVLSSVNVEKRMHPKFGPMSLDELSVDVPPHRIQATWSIMKPVIYNAYDVSMCRPSIENANRTGGWECKSNLDIVSQMILSIVSDMIPLPNIVNPASGIKPELFHRLLKWEHCRVYF